MVRNTLAVILGFVVGGIFVFMFEYLGHLVYPLPDGIDTSNMEQLAEYAKTMPIGAFLFVLLAQCMGSFVGGAVTRIVGKSSFRMLAAIYGALGMAMALLNVLMIPHPLWFIVASLVLPIPLSLAGSTIVSSLVKATPKQTN